MKIAIVAGEPSGDILAAGLIREIRQVHPQARFFGIGGERMLEEGFEQLHPMDAIAVMGVESVIRALRHILAIRRSVRDRVLAERPDCFIGVDVPDFNISLEKRVREAGLETEVVILQDGESWTSTNQE